MIGPHIRTPAALVRRVEVNMTASIVVDDLDVPVAFNIELVQPKLGVDQNSAPRSHAPFTIRWRKDIWGPAGSVPRGSARIQAGDDVYELVGNPRQLLYGGRVVGYEAPACLVDQLYPFSGTLTEQNGIEVHPAMPFAMWGPTETHGSTGEYEDYQAEAPAEFSGQVYRNRHVHMGSKVYRVMTTAVDLTVPHVVFQLRRAGG